MSKSHKKEASEVFTIQFDQVNESSEIPGIAELLGSKTAGKKTARPMVDSNDKTTNIKFNRAASGISIKSLKEFGTRLEIHFQLKDENYRYIQHNDLSHSKFFGLDELFQDMKVSMFFVQEFGAFGEFKQEEKPYLFDAFGITEQPYLQFVLNQANKILTVYVSEKSMATRKDEVIAFTESKNENLSASGIEIDLAA